MSTTLTSLKHRTIGVRLDPEADLPSIDRLLAMAAEKAGVEQVDIRSWELLEVSERRARVVLWLPR